MNLTLDQRTKIFDKVCRLVETKHFNPAMNGVDWNALVKNRRDQILASADKFFVAWQTCPGCGFKIFLKLGRRSRKSVKLSDRTR